MSTVPTKALTALAFVGWVAQSVRGQSSLYGQCGGIVRAIRMMVLFAQTQTSLNRGGLERLRVYLDLAAHISTTVCSDVHMPIR